MSQTEFRSEGPVQGLTPNVTSSGVVNGHRGTARVRQAAVAIWPLVSLLALVGLIVLAVSAFGGLELTSAAENALISLVLVVGLYIFVGNSGVLSFGSVSFVAIGAYTAALLTISSDSKALSLPNLPHFLAVAHFSTPIATLIGGGLAGVIALIVSIPLMRLNGIAAGIATLALLSIVQVVAQNWVSLTGGLGTLTGIPNGLSLAGLMAWVAATLVLAFVYQRSRFGLRLRGTREDEVAARALGVRVEMERRIAWVLSGTILGVGGALYAQYLGAFGPDAFYLDLTFLIIAMLVVGGMRSLAGAVVGTATVFSLTQIFFWWEGGQSVFGVTLPVPSGLGKVIVSLLLLVILLFRPDGLTGGLEVGLPSLRPWRRRRETHEHPARVSE